MRFFSHVFRGKTTPRCSPTCKRPPPGRFSTRRTKIRHVTFLCFLFFSFLFFPFLSSPSCTIKRERESCFTLLRSSGIRIDPNFEFPNRNSQIPSEGWSKFRTRRRRPCCTRHSGIASRLPEFLSR